MAAQHSAYPIRPPVGERVTRRQYQSCDQCRQGRRRCDASLLGIHRPVDAIHAISSSRNASPGELNTCSTCAKTGKRCTFDWLHSLPMEAMPSRRTRYSKTSQPRQLRRQCNIRQSSQAPTISSNGSDVPPHNSTGQVSNIGFAESESLHYFLENQSDVTSRSLSISVSYPPNVLDGEFGFDSSCLPATESTCGRTSISIAHLPLQDWDSPEHAFTWINHEKSITPDLELVGIEPYPFTRELSTEESHFYQGSTDPRLGGTSRETWPFSETQQNKKQKRCQYPLIPELDFRDVEDLLADQVNKRMVANSLTRIYHDSLENALSSWLSGKTCPYTVGSRATGTSILDEWGPSWSNRISTTVCGLDAAFSSLRRSPLSATERRKASQALNTTIMAFASQWSHNVPEQTSGRDPLQGFQVVMSSQANSYTGKDEDELVSGTKTTFDRTLQRDLWHTARRLLQEIAQTDSFKAIFAHMVFAFIQKPLDERGQLHASQRNNANPERRNISSRREHQRTSPKSAAMTAGSVASAVLEDLIDLQGPPLSLEVALRHLFSWRTRLERHRQPKSKFESRTAHGSPDDLHRNGFNLIFWLGVMCDTTSAALNQRPLVISDEDSDIIATNHNVFLKRSSAQMPDTDPLTPLENINLWGNYLLDKNYFGRQSVPRWPCDRDTAAATLSEATPLKVLLYRKVARLQTLLYRRVGPEGIEDGISSALTVYQKWNATYGLFMADCVTHYNTMPPRIQSWFVILSCHWYLACLLLADVIDKMDEDDRGLELQKAHRLICGTTTALRKDNALAISAVATVSSITSPKSLEENTEFHFAISYATLLSEPWTEILMRSFTRAACTLLEMIQYHSDVSGVSLFAPAADAADTNIWHLRRSASACISGLKVLARKSEMANIVATVLEEDLQRCWSLLSNSCGAATVQRVGKEESEPRFSYIREMCDYVSLDTDTSL